MKITYIANIRIPTEKAHGYAIMKMCEQFAKLGVSLDLIVPDRKNQLKEDPFSFYGIDEVFKIVKLKSADFLGRVRLLEKLFYWVDLMIFILAVHLRIKKHHSGERIFYTRDFMILFVLPKKSRIFLELHTMPKSHFLFKRLIKRPNAIFVLNGEIKRELMDMGVSESKIFILPSGVDIEEFDIAADKIEARRKMHLPLDKKIAMYTGHLYSWKGIDTIIEVARQMKDVLFVFIGGIEPDIGRYRKITQGDSNIMFLPFIKRSGIPFYLKAADVLLLPNSKKDDISVKYTSPLKVFEYMAAKRPIVCSDLPSVRQVLDEDMCVFAEPGNSESFKLAIEKVLSDSFLADKLVESAYDKVQKYSWEKRAEKIMDIIETKNIC